MHGSGAVTVLKLKTLNVLFVLFSIPILTLLFPQSNVDISYPTLTPISASPPKSQDGFSDTSSKINPFALGSETVTAVPSPQVHSPSLVGSPFPPPRVQLPTPPSESPVYDRVPLSARLASSLAPSISQAQSSSSASFVTAISPRTEFHSLSPSRANSPTSQSMSLSITSSMAGDEEMFSASSRSSDSLVHVAENHSNVSHSGSEHGDTDVFSDRFSEVSWEDIEGRSSGAVSPRQWR